jgi:hypothetical protein
MWLRNKVDWNDVELTYVRRLQLCIDKMSEVAWKSVWRYRSDLPFAISLIRNCVDQTAIKANAIRVPDAK